MVASTNIGRGVCKASKTFNLGERLRASRPGACSEMPLYHRQEVAEAKIRREREEAASLPGACCPMKYRFEEIYPVASLNGTFGYRTHQRVEDGVLVFIKQCYYSTPLGTAIVQGPSAGFSGNTTPWGNPPERLPKGNCFYV